MRKPLVDGLVNAIAFSKRTAVEASLIVNLLLEDMAPFWTFHVEFASGLVKSLLGKCNQFVGKPRERSDLFTYARPLCAP
jgi:hypothetical protein